MKDPSINEILETLAELYPTGKGKKKLKLTRNLPVTAVGISGMLVDTPICQVTGAIMGVYLTLPSMLEALNRKEEGEIIVNLLKTFSKESTKPLEYIQHMEKIPEEFNPFFSLLTEEEKDDVLPGCSHTTVIFEGATKKGSVSLGVDCVLNSISHKEIAHSKMSIILEDFVLDPAYISAMQLITKATSSTAVKEEEEGTEEDTTKLLYNILLNNTPRDTKGH